MRSTNVTFLLLVLLVAVFASCQGRSPSATEASDTEVTQLPYFNSADFTPEWTAGEHKIPAFSLTNQSGEVVTNDTYRGKIYVADFFFTICPGICPKLTKSMASLQETYADDPDIMLLSHSVMPWHDSTEVLRAYAEEHQVMSGKWNLVTGDKEAIYTLARTGYFADEDFTEASEDGDFIHTENFILVDKEGFIRGVYNGTLGIDVERLKRHIDILKKEPLPQKS